MKTNQMMEVNLGKFGVLNIGHKTQMGSLDDVLEIGNTIRENKGLKPKSLHTYLQSKNTWELILKVHSEENKKDFLKFQKNSENSENTFCEISQKLLYQETLDNLPTFKNGQINYSEAAKTKILDNVFKIQNRGKFENRGTWANLFIILDLAQWLDVDLRYEIYRVFIEEKILQHRNDGGSEFKKLNILIDTLEDRTTDLKPNGNKGCYIQTAKRINAKVNGAFSKGWNDKKKANTEQELRASYLRDLCFLIEKGFVKTYSSLTETIDKL